MNSKTNDLENLLLDSDNDLQLQKKPREEKKEIKEEEEKKKHKIRR